MRGKSKKVSNRICSLKQQIYEEESNLILKDTDTLLSNISI